MKKIVPILIGIVMLALLSLTSSKKDSPRFNHVMLYVSDLEKSIQFYTTAFDLEVTNRLNSLTLERPDGTTSTVEVKMAFLKFPGQKFVYELSEQPELESPQGTALFQHVGVDVEDIDVAFKKMHEAGGEFLSSVKLVKANGVSAKNAFFRGPDGEIIELMELVSGEF
jgi:catechol 2,3-dioxygenase-like lactoylglutathione lyase family enzyme